MECAPVSFASPRETVSRRESAGHGRRPIQRPPELLHTLHTVDHIGRGLTNGEIAVELSISTATAKAHVARLLTKLIARDRVQLVIIAYETGLASPPP
jgi:DNA-binding NarL/FixJ family response regulator